LNVCATGATYTKIQDALVDAASTGDTIEVCAGTFTEQLVVDKSVKLVGAGAGETTIAAPSTLTGLQNIVTISGSGVSVELTGFTISGPGPAGDCAGMLAGVFVRGGAHADIHDNTITEMRNTPFDGCQKGFGVRVGICAACSSDPTSGTATITNNTITEFQKTGIVVDNADSDAAIEPAQPAAGGRRSKSNRTPVAARGR